MFLFGYKKFYTQAEAVRYFFGRSVPSRVMVQDYKTAKEEFINLSVDDQLTVIFLVSERGVASSIKWLKRNSNMHNKRICMQIVMYAACHGRGGLVRRTAQNFNRAKKIFIERRMQFQ